MVPQNGLFIMENPIKMDDLGSHPYFWKHPFGFFQGLFVSCLWWSLLVYIACIVPRDILWVPRVPSGGMQLCEWNTGCFDITALATGVFSIAILFSLCKKNEDFWNDCGSFSFWFNNDCVYVFTTINEFLLFNFSRLFYDILKSLLVILLIAYGLRMILKDFFILLFRQTMIRA